MRPIGHNPTEVVTEDAHNLAEASVAPVCRESSPADWPTVGHIVYEGNGAVAQRYSVEFDSRGLHGSQSSSGSGARRHIALQAVTEHTSSRKVINGFVHNYAEFVGFHARQKTAESWKWLREDGTWQDDSDGAVKLLVHPNQDISELGSTSESNIVLVAQWKTPSGQSANCGSIMFSNSLMAHALGGYRKTAYHNTRVAFQHSVENHHTYFEVDLSFTSDDRLVASSPRTRSKNPRNIEEMTYERVMGLTTHGEPIMDARQLYELIRDHPDYSFEIDFHRVVGEDAKKRIRALLDDFHHDEDVLGRLLIQVHSAQMHKDIDSVYKFRHYQYLLGMKMERLDSAITYCLDTGICALALRWGLVTPSVISKIKVAGLFILCYTVEQDAPLADALLRAGIDTVCTDHVTPRMLQLAHNSMGQNQFHIYYHSGSPKAVVRSSTLTSRSAARSTVHALKSGALEVRDDRLLLNNGLQQLKPPMFKVRGRRFVGWRMRLRIDGKPRWYCTDGTLRSTKEVRVAPATERALFHEDGSLPIIQTVEGAKVVMEAAWEPASRVVRFLDRWLPKRRG